MGLARIRNIATIVCAMTLVSAHTFAGMVEDATKDSTASSDISAGGKWVLGIVVVIFGFRLVKGMFSR